jgi:hypothetical protein
MVDFAKLKAMSGKKSLEALNAELQKLNAPQEKNSSDDRFWTASVDKAGNGYAVIRFLPPADGEDVPFVRVFDHGFQGPTGLWYIENSLTTIGKQDPVTEYNSKLWNSTTDDEAPERKQVRKQKRRLHFISNIYVVNDPSNPDNEGKVFLYKYGKKIFDKLNEAMNPQFADEEAVNPFDFWAGANFKLKIRKVEGYRNYDRSEFDRSGPLLDDDAGLQAIYEKQYSLKAFLDPSKFKPFEELQERLLKVLDENSAPAKRAKAAAATTAEDTDLPWTPEETSAAPKFKAAPAPKAAVADDDEDESLEFFKNLATK